MLRRRKRARDTDDDTVAVAADFESEAVRIIRPDGGAVAGSAQSDGLDRAGNPAASVAGGGDDLRGRAPVRVVSGDSRSSLDPTAPDGIVLPPSTAATGSRAGLDDPTAPDASPGGGHGTDPLLRTVVEVDGGRSTERLGGSSSVRVIIGDDEVGAADALTDRDGDGYEAGTAGIVYDPRTLGGATSAADVTGGDPQRRTVVIADDGASAQSAEPAPSARRGMDPRFRERRRAVRRALGRRRMVGLAGGLIVVAVVFVVAALLASGLFAVRAADVEVIGWRHADRAQMEAVLDELIGTPVLRVDEDRVAEQFEAIAWVESAKVSSHLPNSATVEISERTPLATFQGPDARYRIIDRYGRVLDITDGFPVEFVWITSSNSPNLEVGEFAPAGFTAAAELSRNFTPTIRPRVQRIAVEPSGQALVLYLRDGSRVNFGAANDLFSKLVRLETLVTTYADMTDAEIDVSTEETTRASDDLLKIKEAERQREAEQAAEAEAAAAEAAAAEAADNGAATDDGAAADGATADGGGN